MDRRCRRSEIEKPLPKCEWCDERHLLKVVRVFDEEVKVCIRCKERIRRYDRVAYEWDSPWANPVRKFPPETRARFFATGMDALQAAKAGEHARSIIVPQEFWGMKKL